MSSPFGAIKRLMFGRPLPSDRLEHERLSKKTALAVLSSDAISSVAYATEQTLLVLAVLGTAALTYVVPISAIIVALLVLVVVSYRETIFAYPGGGGWYTVAKDHLGTLPGLIAAAAVFVSNVLFANQSDYILTVSVSIAGGVAAITSAYPVLKMHTVGLCIGAVVLLMLVNLRGVRESGAAFSVPTYVFVVMMVGMIGVGLFHMWTGAPAVSARAPTPAPVSGWTGFALTFLLLRGFAEGCAAMTGTEAISNGVGAFKSPNSKNAAITLGWMAAILAVFFLATSVLARHYMIMPTPSETVLSQLGRSVFGNGAVYYAFQYATFAILVLAANTAFADFPRLASILARDGYMPRQFMARGDRLAFSNGIIALAVVAAVLIALFRGETSALIPLYAIGVFVCFTLSQAGMVAHWLRLREPGWQRRAILNGLGAAATAVVSVVQVVTKFTHGAWIVVLIIPVIILVLRRIHRHYENFAREVAYTGQSPLMFLHHTVVVPVNGITRPAAGALVYATTISEDVRAVYVAVDPELSDALRHHWEEWDIGVALTILDSPCRSIMRPLVQYVNGLVEDGHADLVTIVVPEIVPRSWFGHLLHNKTSLFIRTAFLFRPNVVVTTVPYLIGRAPRLRDLAALDETIAEIPELATKV